MINKQTFHLLETVKFNDEQRERFQNNERKQKKTLSANARVTPPLQQCFDTYN